MKTLGYYNGQIDELDKILVPMNDRACSFGDGVYDSAYARRHIIARLPEHVERILSGCQALDIAPPCTKDEMIALLSDLVKRVDDDESFVYWQISRGTQPRAHIYESGLASNLWVAIQPMPIRDTYKKIKLISLPDLRHSLCHIKTLNLLAGTMAATEAFRAGADECVLHRSGRVTECSRSNIGFLKNGSYITPPEDQWMLPGIQRAHTIAMCKRLGVPVEVRPFSLSELMAADEVIVSSVGSLCLAASSIDGCPVGGKAPALLKRLQDALEQEFDEATSGDAGEPF